MLRKSPFRLTSAVAAVIIVAIAIAGCRHHVDTTNPVVIQAVTLNDAEKTVNTIAHGLKAAHDVVEQLQSSEPDYYRAVIPKLALIARMNESANQCIVQATNGGQCDWRSAIAIIATQVGNPSSLTTAGFKNSSSQQKVQLGFAVLMTGLDLAIQFQKVTGGGQ